MTLDRFNRKGTNFSTGYHTLEEMELPNGDRAVVLVYKRKELKG